MVGSMIRVYERYLYFEVLYIKCIQIIQNMKTSCEHVENSKHKLENMLFYMDVFYNILRNDTNDVF